MVPHPQTMTQSAILCLQRLRNCAHYGAIVPAGDLKIDHFIRHLNRSLFEELPFRFPNNPKFCIETFVHRMEIEEGAPRTETFQLQVQTEAEGLSLSLQRRDGVRDIDMVHIAHGALPSTALEEDFTNPHAPHTATVQAPVVPTKTLIEYREQKARKQIVELRSVAPKSLSTWRIWGVRCCQASSTLQLNLLAGLYEASSNGGNCFFQAGIEHLILRNFAPLENSATSSPAEKESPVFLVS
ncbi:hypothetical protein SBOR_3979 [Sclerotinia borealis F-4128]|uniref:Uncharacterized protein n=1 Tax=Sclerotinia borealis (strain F-4128) TaxID=1432307 RepID=W9CIC8_SCLBF|nr:hypothetical protein SBOR_3979 [Sclerotinia borealis F-4128]